MISVSTRHHSIALLLVFFFMQQHLAYSQPKSTPMPENRETADQGTLKIYPVGHATAVLNWNETVIYIDPVGGPDAFTAYPAPDLILITDIHGDHFSLETLQGLAS